MTLQQPVEIIDFKPEYQPDFYRLNEAWIAPNFGLEEEDINFLQNPQTEILDKGGAIFFAKVGDEIAGTGGLYKMDDETYELIRLAVDARFQGLKLGKRLVEHAILWAKQQHAKRVILETSAQPINQTAIRLYEKLGFQHYTPRPEHRSALDRAEVWMTLEPLP